MRALNRPVRVNLHGAHPHRRTEIVKPSDVVAAHNAQTEDPADHLVLRGQKAVIHEIIALQRERDEARAEVERLRAALRRCIEDAEWHLRGESGLPFADAYSCLRAVAEGAREALGEQA